MAPQQLLAIPFTKFMWLYSRVSNTGIRYASDDLSESKIRLVNQIAIIVILVILPHCLITLFAGFYFQAYIQLAAMLHLSLVILLNQFGYFKAARILALIVGNLHILNMVTMLGPEGGIQYYFSAAIITPLFVFDADEYLYIFFFATLTVVLALTSHLIADHLSPIMPISADTLRSFFYLSVVGSLITVFGFVYYFFNESSRFQSSLRSVNKKLEILSETDSLTGLPNRRAFEFKLAAEWMLARNSAEPLVVMMLDIDYFKQFNDHYGHVDGDSCLTIFADVLRQSLRADSDTGFRYGGEEFVAILSNTTQEQSIAVAERIQSSLAQRYIPHPKSLISDYLTCSIGLACTADFEQGSAASLVRAADAALYDAKHNGRNQIAFLDN